MANGLPTSGRSTRATALGATRWWRTAAWLVAALVAGTAAMARQQIAVDPVNDVAYQNNAFTGLIRPRDITTLALPNPVIVKRVLVTVGDRVAAGMPIAELDDEDAARQLEQLRFEAERAHAETSRLEELSGRLGHSIETLTASLADANAELAIAQRATESIPSRQVKDSPARAQAAYDQAVAHARRLAELSRTGVIARQEIEDAEFAVKLAADDLEIARRTQEASDRITALQALQARAQAGLTVAEQRRRLTETNGELTQARLRESQADAAVQSASDRLADLVVRAPAASTVAELTVRPGDRVLAATPIARLATTDPMIVDIEVAPSLVNTLHRGEDATIHITGTSMDFTGRVVTIAPLPGDGGAHAVQVEFANPDGTLLTGQTAKVRFAMRPGR